MIRTLGLGVGGALIAGPLFLGGLEHITADHDMLRAEFDDCLYQHAQHHERTTCIYPQDRLNASFRDTSSMVIGAGAGALIGAYLDFKQYSQNRYY